MTGLALQIGKTHLLRKATLKCELNLSAGYILWKVRGINSNILLINKQKRKVLRSTAILIWTYTCFLRDLLDIGPFPYLRKNKMK